MKTLGSCQESDLQPMESQLTLFAGATHANRSPQPGSEKGREMTAYLWPNIYDLYAEFGLVGSLKMLLVTSAWASTACYLTRKLHLGVVYCSSLCRQCPDRRDRMDCCPRQQRQNTAATKAGQREEWGKYGHPERWRKKACYLRYKQPMPSKAGRCLQDLERWVCPKHWVAE